jgi:hypothetical protein
MRIHVALMGGLGNQLFQLAAALHLAKKNNEDIFLNPNLGHYRQNSFELPEINSYSIPKHIIVLKKRFYRKWLSKVLGHSRKIFISPSGFEKIFAYNFIVARIANLHKFIVLGRGGNIKVIEEVGYQELEMINQSTILLGYFQSYRHVDPVLDQLRKLSTQEFISIQEEYKLKASTSSPLVVHVRLGDYLLENSFGVPDVDYYEKAIERQMLTKKYDSIWLFSDEPEKAKLFIPSKYEAVITFVTEAQNSSAATLEIMRYGAGFVIGNSTFSWWGAKLAHKLNPDVVAPQPWFKGMAEPKDIVPPEWLRIQAWTK